MIRIAARFGDRVDNAASRATVLCGVVRGVYLELLHGGLRDGVRGARTTALFRVESLVVIGSIHLAVVEEKADATEA